MARNLFQSQMLFQQHMLPATFFALQTHLVLIFQEDEEEEELKVEQLEIMLE